MKIFVFVSIAAVIQKKTHAERIIQLIMDECAVVVENKEKEDVAAIVGENLHNYTMNGLLRYREHEKLQLALARVASSINHAYMV